jgi:hypothetical protein
MNNSEEALDLFFDQYEKRFNDALEGTMEADKIASSFADCFVQAHPHGVICGNNDEEFKKAIPKGYEFYRNIGVTAMKINSKEITSLDSMHCMVKVDWKMMYKKLEDVSGAIEFEVTYFLQKRSEGYKIFGYITGDEEAVLKQHDLI